ncbi:MAG: hypothetical protein ACRD0P_01175 [Stackebrandtia sp.]
MSLPYTGSGPYCYANCLSMMLGPDSPGPAYLEVLTGSPFGMQLLGGRIPLFDPYGWDPDLGIDAALASLGWECRRSTGGDSDTALSMLRAAVKEGPVMVGPVELGLLRHQPGMTGALGADHWVVVLDIDGDTVVMHDPQGYPYATLPVAEFALAWQADQIPWINAPFVMRTEFRKTRDIGAGEALRTALPAAVDWLSNKYDGPVPPGNLGTAEALYRLAELTEAGLDGDTRGHLVHFAVRVGARRLNDAAVALAEIGEAGPATIAARQSRLLGSLQYDLVNGDDAKAAATMRRMAPGYDELAAALR